MHEYRITKYDPDLRDENGWYTRDEWISVSDVGRSYDGVVLTREEYDRVEDAYATSALAFMREAGIESLQVTGLENHFERELSFVEGDFLSLEQAEDVIRRVLREEFWCRLEAPEAFIHLGYDYYMYVGVPREVPEAEGVAGILGLFVEPFDSPHKPEAEEEEEEEWGEPPGGDES